MARYGLDGFLGGVVIAAVADPQHLGGQRSIAQQHIGKLLDRCMLMLGQALQILHHGRQRGQLRLIEALDPRLHTLGTYIQEVTSPQCHDGKWTAVCPR